jgi:hypothetical protein
VFEMHVVTREPAGGYWLTLDEDEGYDGEAV